MLLTCACVDYIIYNLFIIETNSYFLWWVQLIKDWLTSSQSYLVSEYGRNSITKEIGIDAMRSLARSQVSSSNPTAPSLYWRQSVSFLRRCVKNSAVTQPRCEKHSHWMDQNSPEMAMTKICLKTMMTTWRTILVIHKKMWRARSSLQYWLDCIF